MKLNGTIYLIKHKHILCNFIILLGVVLNIKCVMKNIIIIVIHTLHFQAMKIFSIGAHSLNFGFGW